MFSYGQRSKGADLLNSYSFCSFAGGTSRIYPSARLCLNTFAQPYVHPDIAKLSSQLTARSCNRLRRYRLLHSKRYRRRRLQDRAVIVCADTVYYIVSSALFRLYIDLDGLDIADFVAFLCVGFLNSCNEVFLCNFLASELYNYGCLDVLCCCSLCPSFLCCLFLRLLCFLSFCLRSLCLYCLCLCCLYFYSAIANRCCSHFLCCGCDWILLCHNDILLKNVDTQNCFPVIS